jgi:hypothetical protein
MPRVYKTEGGKMWEEHFMTAVKAQRRYKEANSGPGGAYRVVQSGKNAGKIVPRAAPKSAEHRAAANMRARERRAVKKIAKHELAAAYAANPLREYA